MKGNFWFFIVACAISAILPVLCSKKIGRDGVLSLGNENFIPDLYYFVLLIRYKYYCTNYGKDSNY